MRGPDRPQQKNKPGKGLEPSTTCLPRHYGSGGRANDIMARKQVLYRMDLSANKNCTPFASFKELFTFARQIYIREFL
jgi:hypothetical protein